MVLARRFIAAGALVLVAGTAADANAQQIYRIVGPDGRITFSDKAPVEAGSRVSNASAGTSGGNGANLSGLPYELRHAAARYPVTLYTSPGCSTCATGRTMLMTRGIPFAEKTVTSNDDIEAFKRMGATTVPMLTIGSQQLKGFSDSEWTQFLDAAGYPQTSQLPASYLPSAATPLVAQGDTPPRAPAPARQTAPAPAARPLAPTESANNPAGIQF